MKQNDEIENLFESTFDDFSVEPPPSLKVAVDEKIKFKKRFSKLWMFIPLSLLLITVIGFMLFNNTNTIDKTVTTSNTTISENISSNKHNNLYSDTSDQSKNNSESNQTISKNSDNSGIQSQNNTLNKNVESNSTSLEGKVNSSKTVYSSNKISNNQSKKQSKSSENRINNTKNKSKQKHQKQGTGSDQIKNQSQNNGTVFNVQNNTNQTKNSNSQNLTNVPVGNTSVIGSDNKNNLATSGENNSGSSSIIGSDSNVPNGNSEKTSDPVSFVPNYTDSSNNEIDTLNTNLTLNTINTAPIDSLLGKKKDASTASWLLSARFGYPIISNTLTNEEYSLTEKNTFFINAEASYLFKNNVTITSGFQYNQYQNNLTFNTTKSDSLLIGIDSVVIADTANPQNDTIICVPMYEYINANTFYRQLYNQTSISIPLYFGYSYAINNNWFIDLNGGIILSYQQAKLVSSDPQIPDPTIRTFGFKTCIRPQIRYQFNDNLGVSISSNFGYDFVPTLNWESVARKRIYSEFGIGFHYGF